MPVSNLVRKPEVSRRGSPAASGPAGSGCENRLLSNVSHELRTPLNVVLGMLQLSLAEDLAPPARRYLETAKESALSLASLLNDILDYSHIISGALRIGSHPFSLRQTIRETLLSVVDEAEAKGLQVQCEVGRAIPDQLLGDAVRLRQALLHLLTNAVKFTDEGRLEVNVALDGRRSDQVVLAFSIVDSGVGIASQDQLRIFAPFEQVDNSTTRMYGGAGLGLAIAAGLLLRMGGRLSVESRVGEGSRFLVQLPFRLPGGREPDNQAAERQSDSSPPHPGLSILLAEDTPGNQQVIASVLQKRGHRTLIASNGREAVELFQTRSGEIDVILMDVQMPVMDGYAATAEIRRLEAAAGGRTPIIALTAHALHGDQQRCLEAGMDAYISKPIDIERLTEAVESLGQSGRPGAGCPAEPLGGPAPQAVDIPAAMKRLGGDVSLLKEFVRVFDEDSPLLVQALRAALAASDAAALQRAAHSLKGLTANFGASAVVELASALETMGRDGGMQQAPPLLEQLQGELVRVSTALERYRDGG